jgi:hypothetical protein
MNAIKKARKMIESAPDEPSSGTLASLVLSLESESDFNLSSLYATDLRTFELALDILREWRIDRYYLSKFKLLDIAIQHGELAKTTTSQ